MELTKLARTEIERLLNNYSLAISGGSSFTAPGFNLFASNDVRHGPSIPILYGEADETRKALELLPGPQREILMLQYVTRPPVRSRFEKMQLSGGATTAWPSSRTTPSGRLYVKCENGMLDTTGKKSLNLATLRSLRGKYR
jgi:hypothetical protein